MPPFTPPFGSPPPPASSVPPGPGPYLPFPNLPSALGCSRRFPSAALLPRVMDRGCSLGRRSLHLQTMHMACGCVGVWCVGVWVCGCVGGIRGGGEGVWVGGGGVGTRPWWLALLACGGAYWPLAFEPSAMTSRHPYYCGHPHCRGGGGASRMHLLPMASSSEGLFSAQYAVITKTPGGEVLTTIRNGNVTQGHGCWLTIGGGGWY